MPRFKASKNNRTTYIYISSDGEKIEITPDTVGEKWISILHEMDDEEIDQQRRENYHVPVHLDSFADKVAENGVDYNPYLADEESDPLEQMIQSINALEQQDRLDQLNLAIKNLKPEQQNLLKEKYDLGKSNLKIAAEEGVSEAAIRQRLKTIYNTIRKNFEK